MTRRARQYHRTPVCLDVEVVADGDSIRLIGIAADISIGGMFIETATSLPMASKVTVRLRVPRMDGELVMPAIVRWTAPNGMGVQLGMLGARDTHAITEIARESRRKQLASVVAA